jgi:hypothetical protein
MRWLVKLGSDTLGPVDENTALEILRANPGAWVRGEGGGTWLAAKDSPFAAYLAPPRPPQSSQMSMGGRLLVALLVVAISLVFASVAGWPGVACGLVLVIWTLVAYVKETRSLLSVLLERKHGIFMTIGSLMIGAALVLQGGKAVMATRERERQRENVQKLAREAEQRAEEMAEGERQADLNRRRAELLAALPDEVVGWRSKLAEARRESTRGPYGPSTAVVLTRLVVGEIEKATALIEPPIPELTAIHDEARQQYAALDLQKVSREKAKDVRDYVKLAASAERERNFLYADECYEKALASLDDLEKRGDAVNRHLPRGFTLSAQRAEVTRRRVNIATAVANARDQEGREEWSRKKREEWAAEKVGRGAALQDGIRIPTDSGASYAVLSRGGTARLPTLTTRRSGSSGVSYAKRQFDCGAHTFAYLGEGEDLSDVQGSTSSSAMSDLVEGSISDYWWHYACGG